MLSGLFGQFVGGVVWAIGANVTTRALRGEDTDTLREATKVAVKTYLTLARRMQATGDELRAGFEQIVAEAEAEIPAAETKPSSEQP